MKKDNKSKAAPPPAKVEGEIETKIKPGQIVVVVLEKGQEPIEIKITKEMAQDREAALTYGISASKSQWDAQIKRAIAIALYAGQDTYAPWAIDSQYDSFEKAATGEFGLARSSIYNYLSFGRALIAAKGTENILEHGEKILAELKTFGFDKLSLRKIPLLQKGVKEFESFLKTGRFEAANGDVFTVAQIVEKGVGQLPLLFERFAEPKAEKESQLSIPGKHSMGTANELGMTAEAPKALLSAKETEERIDKTLTSVLEGLYLGIVTLQKESELWPENALAVINASPNLQLMIETIRDYAARINSALYAAETEPDKIPEILGYAVENSELHQLAEFRLKLSLAGFCKYHALPETAAAEIAEMQGVKVTDTVDNRTFARYHSEWKKSKGN